MEDNEVSVHQNQKKSLKIKGCRSLHMILFDSDGSVQTKINICSCPHCLVGDFINCVDEKGKFFPVQPLNDSVTTAELSHVTLYIYIDAIFLFI